MYIIYEYVRCHIVQSVDRPSLRRALRPRRAGRTRRHAGLSAVGTQAAQIGAARCGPGVQGAPGGLLGAAVHTAARGGSDVQDVVKECGILP